MDHLLTWTPCWLVLLIERKSETMKATRYVLIFTLTSNWSSNRPPGSCNVLSWSKEKKKRVCLTEESVFPWKFNSSCHGMIYSSFRWNTEGLINRFYRYYSTLGMFERAICFASLRIRMEKFALKAGSSKQGKAARALVGSNCVEATTLKTWMAQ